VNEPIRLGGMALANGVLVHGPTSWAVAVRADDGSLKVGGEPKRLIGNRVENPLLRGPARLLEAFWFLPRVKRVVPEAKMPYERPGVLVTMLATGVAVQQVRRSRLARPVQEVVSGLLSLTPALLALRGGSLAAYHGAEHISIGSYEHGEPRSREHERCGSHLVGPLIATSAAGNILASRAPESARALARAASTVGAVAASMEIFGWMQRHPDHPVARALARPGHELQHRFATAEPTPEQLEVAEAALQRCLELEGGDANA
jgi:uncharacterized protein YqhQ